MRSALAGEARQPVLALLVGLFLELTPGPARPSSSGTGQERTGPQATFPAGAEIVTVDVVVADRGGVPILDLRREDFTVLEDGVVQDVTAFDAVDRRPGAAGPRTPLPGVTSNVDAAARESRSFVLVFDELHLDPAEAQRARKAVASFLEAGVADGDRVTLVGTAEGTRWTARMPAGRDALLQVLDRLKGRRVGEIVQDAISEYEAFRIDRERDPIVLDRVLRRFYATGAIRKETRVRGDEPDRGENLDADRDQVRARAAQAYARHAARDETTLGILERGLASLTAVRGRKTVILVSGGFVHDSQLPGFRRVVQESRRANAALYFLDARGLGAAPSGLQAASGASLDFNDLGSTLTETRERSGGSEGLAADTGGFSIRDDNDLEGGIARIARESASYYLLGYAPSDRRADGRFRKIEVKVAREGAVVRARRGYFAPGGREAANAPPEPRDAAIQRALDSPFDLEGVPLRAAAHVLGESAPGKARVFITAEADIRGFAFEERGGTAKDTLEMMLVVAHRETGEFHRFDQQLQMSFSPETRARFARSWFPITREVPLVPGAYQARLVVRDRRSGRLGTLTHDFEVPPLQGLRISTPLLSDRLREGGGAAPEPIAQRTFTASGVLHAQFEVFGAATDAKTGAPNVTAGFSIRRADGRFLTAAPETPMKPGAGGGLSRTFGIPLAGAPPGRYELILVVTDLVAGAGSEARESFEIAGSGE
ncbi:MAG TPA: VWA domain-containing protein [Vicinamibacteria bacterium]